MNADQDRPGRKARWRHARRQHECDGYDRQYTCETVIQPGEWYLDLAISDPDKYHMRYCAGCAKRKGYTSIPDPARGPEH